MAALDPQTFALHPRLEADTLHVADLGVSQLRLMNDSRYLWVLLIPRVEGAREWHHLSNEDSNGLHTEMRAIATIIEGEANAFKMNVGALGNMVPQLHLHIIARHEGDAAWPGPVWGVGDAVPYDDDAAKALIQTLWHKVQSLDTV